MKNILIVVDYQNDFVDPNGSLPVYDADKISKNIQNKINDKKYENIIYTFDTHTSDEYFKSDEQKIFPNIHCEFNTNGWNLFKIKPRNNKEFQIMVNNMNEPFNFYDINDEFFFTKNVFDIWNGNSIYPKWFENNFNKDEVIVIGVATNYCVFMNVMGLVKRGYKINIIEDSVKGIKNFPDGSIDDSFDNNISIMKNKNVNFI